MRTHVLALSMFAMSIAAVVGAQQPEHDHGAMPAATATVAGSAAPAKARDGAMIDIPSTIGKGSGYLAQPKSTGRHPAIIVIHEWWGLNDWAKDQADRFAAQGFVALGVDLYRGRSTDDPAVAHELSRGLPEDRAVADLKGAFALLAKRKDVDKKHIGVIGWCMGGGYALDLALAEPALAVCVINYGHLIADPTSIARIHAPILGNFGANDRGITPADVAAFDVALKTGKKSGDLKVYPGAGHGFMNPNNKGGYVAEAATDAWKRIDGFLHARLAGTSR